MSDSWLDRIPSNERQRIREKLHLSEAEYARLREKVKGPEDLEREMDRNELLAELKFQMESEPKLAEALRAQCRRISVSMVSHLSYVRSISQMA